MKKKRQSMRKMEKKINKSNIQTRTKKNEITLEAKIERKKFIAVDILKRKKI